VPELPVLLFCLFCKLLFLGVVFHSVALRLVVHASFKSGGGVCHWLCSDNKVLVNNNNNLPLNHHTPTKASVWCMDFPHFHFICFAGCHSHGGVLLGGLGSWVYGQQVWGCGFLGGRFGVAGFQVMGSCRFESKDLEKLRC
jgi:hypothetical protein